MRQMVVRVFSSVQHIATESTANDRTETESSLTTNMLYFNWVNEVSISKSAPVGAPQPDKMGCMGCSFIVFSLSPTLKLSCSIHSLTRVTKKKRERINTKFPLAFAIVTDKSIYLFRVRTWKTKKSSNCIRLHTVCKWMRSVYSNGNGLPIQRVYVRAWMY